MNTADLITYQSIIYHTESLLEMQIACTVAVWLIQRYEEKSSEVQSDNVVIMYTLFVVHVAFYWAGVFRNYDIANYGRPDLWGIMRAPRETILYILEIFVDCIIFGYVVKHMSIMSME